MDDVLETRAVPINMPDSSRSFKEEITEESSLEFKERLVAFRARNINKKLPDILKPAEKRLGDIFKPIFQIADLVYPEKRKALNNLIYSIQKRKLIEFSESLDMQIIKEVVNLKNRVCGGILSVKEITEGINLDKLDRYKLSPTKIGKRLSAIGFDKARTSNGASAIVYDQYKINNFATKYNIVTSEASEVSGRITERSESSEGIKSLR